MTKVWKGKPGPNKFAPFRAPRAKGMSAAERKARLFKGAEKIKIGDIWVRVK